MYRLLIISVWFLFICCSDKRESNSDKRDPEKNQELTPNGDEHESPLQGVNNKKQQLRGLVDKLPADKKEEFTQRIDNSQNLDDLNKIEEELKKQETPNENPGGDKPNTICPKCNKDVSTHCKKCNACSCTCKKDGGDGDKPDKICPKCNKDVSTYCKKCNACPCTCKNGDDDEQKQKEEFDKVIETKIPKTADFVKEQYEYRFKDAKTPEERGAIIKELQETKYTSYGYDEAEDDKAQQYEPVKSAGFVAPPHDVDIKTLFDTEPNCTGNVDAFADKLTTLQSTNTDERILVNNVTIKDGEANWVVGYKSGYIEEPKCNGKSLIKYCVDNPDNYSEDLSGLKHHKYLVKQGEFYYLYCGGGIKTGEKSVFFYKILKTNEELVNTCKELMTDSCESYGKKLLPHIKDEALRKEVENYFKIKTENIKSIDDYRRLYIETFGMVAKVIETLQRKGFVIDHSSGKNGARGEIKTFKKNYPEAFTLCCKVIETWKE